jgi:hypothetical protein
METHFLLAFGEEEFLAPLAITASKAFFNKLLDARGDRNSWEASWSWRPEGKVKLEINWGTGMGGFRGALKRSGSGELVGKMEEYCDSHCSYKTRVGSLHVQKISCGPD